MKHRIHPSFWIPTLYLGESFPLAAVTIIGLLLYQEMGLGDATIAFCTTLFGLPWIIKPLWSPIVDSIKTKRWWVWTMQLLMGAALACVAFVIPASFWFLATFALFMLVAFQSATHDICADGYYILSLSDKDQELYVGVRNTFYRIGTVFAQGGLVALAGLLQKGFWFIPASTVPISWSIVFLVLSALLIMLGLYHKRVLPKVEGEDATETVAKSRIRISEVVCEFGRTWKIFFSKPHILTAFCFILLFRLPEGMLTKIVPLFLKRTYEEGGLQLDNETFGLIQGTIGVVGLLGGGLLGGWLVSRYGLKRCLWPLVLCITLPDIIYVYLSAAQPHNLWIVGTGICIEQIGYGLGFTAYTLYLVSFARGEHSTAVFSLCTAIQYLGGIVLPGIVAGWLRGFLDYNAFFWVVMGCCLVTFAVSALAKIPEGNEVKN